MFHLLISVIGPFPISLFEWLLHRFVMHKPVGRFRYPYIAHTKVHHDTFRANETYHLHDPKDAATITMAWWNGVVLVAIGTLLTIPFSLWFGRWSLSLIMAIEFALYYVAYESLHWCMHQPPERIARWTKFPIIGWPFGVVFRFLNGHHLLHHQYMNKNFNVVLPLADLMLGTLLLRAKNTFIQAQGEVVPDVQPAKV